MSTMLKSAAMTILSKTLQTFLYKYLSDVDVEGVALPSLLDSDGHSGWGVRLCNVKLRDGVHLMELPGKLQKKKKREQTTQQDKEDSDEENQKEAAVEKESVSTDEAAAPVQNGEEPHSAATKKSRESEAIDLPRVAEKEEEQKQDEGEMFSIPKSETEEDTSLARHTLQTAEDSDSDSIMSHPSQPNTPNQSSTGESSRFLGCLYRGSKSARKSRSRSVSRDEDEIFEDTVPAEPKTEIKDGHTSSEPPMPDNVGAQSVEEPHEPLNEQDKEEYEYVDQGMVLRLGPGGRIGTLDIRLVGKELHVLVEDAFLTVEAVPRAAAEAEGDAKESKKSTESQSKDASKKPPDAPKTPGERILAESAIARMLSAIPHLFLRDINIRLIIREDETAPGDSENKSQAKDATMEFGIEFLSVTSGEDFLSPFHVDEDPSTVDEEENESERHISSLALENADRNEYLIKRIRTGKGPEGGLWLKIFPPPERSLPKAALDEPHIQWARHTWTTTTQYNFFQCSGLDIRARIFLGTKKEIAILNNEYVWYGEEYDEYTLDSMLYGVDYVAPGPTPPLPPIVRRGASTDSFSKDLPKAYPGCDEYTVDKNGIQSSTMKSNFHRVARGLTPTICDQSHLPCENCPLCWEHASGSGKNEHKLDNATPLPGIVLQFSMRDPVELNVDRQALDVLGLVKTLFTAPPKAAAESEDSNEDGDDNSTVGSIGESQRSRSSLLARRQNGETETHRTSLSELLHLRKTTLTNDLSESFPAYMQPQTIQVMGLYFSALAIRIHVMRSGSNDGGLSFCYWDTVARCVTLDRQQLSAQERSFEDLRFDIGHLRMVECSGVERRHLVSMGFRHPAPNDIETASLASSHAPYGGHNRSPWPSTASALLDVLPPLDTLMYEPRERHALQMRYMWVRNQDDSDTIRKHANIRLGMTTLQIPYAIKQEIYAVKGEAMACLFGPSNQAREDPPDKESDSTEKDAAPGNTSLMKYKIQADGGNLNVYPVVNARFPLTKFGGEISSEAGFSMDSILNRFELSYGTRQAPPSTSSCLSMLQMAALPDSVRLRILLFLKDLKPLEKALGVKRESNSFLRCRAVNKGIVKMAKKLGKESKHEKKVSITTQPNNRRQEVLTEILKLDDAALENLWATHQKQQKKMSRRRSDSAH